MPRADQTEIAIGVSIGTVLGLTIAYVLDGSLIAKLALVLVADIVSVFLVMVVRRTLARPKP